MSRKIRPLPGICAAILLLVLAGCGSSGSPGTWFLADPESGGGVTSADLFDMKLQHAETSPIPGASARVMAAPPGIAYSGAPVGACVTDAGYCPLAAQTEPGQNCLCTAANGTYGGTTGIPPKYNTKTNPE